MASGDTLVTFIPLGASTPATVFATFNVRNNHPILEFDAATEWSCYFEGFLPSTYAGGGLTVTLHWLGATATTGDVKWGSSVERLDSGTDEDADSFAAEQTGTTTTSGTSGAPVTTAITHSSGANMDSLAASEPFRLKIARKAADVADTMTGNAQIIRVIVKET